MAKKTIQLKKRYTGEVIFEYSGDNIREVVEKAIKSGVSLKKVDLQNSDLTNLFDIVDDSCSVPKLNVGSKIDKRSF